MLGSQNICAAPNIPTAVNSVSIIRPKYLYENGVLTSVVNGLSVMCSYNDNGDLIESFFRRSADTFEYLEYDCQSKWISRIEYHKNIPVKFVGREIEYY